jgi:hypothetical protein
MKGKRNEAPKRKRLNGKASLLDGQSWINTYNGRNLVKGYGEWYGVDWLCAFKELKLI